MSEKQGVEIDYCPSCRGVWLDRGELEKIIERSYTPENQQQPPVRGSGSFFGNSHDSDHHDSHGYNKYGRKRNFLSELFD